MATRRKANRGWLPLVLVAVAVVLWLRGQQTEVIRNFPETSVPSAPPAATQTAGGYEHFTGCTLVPESHNDGDSFLVRLPDKRQVVLRLYYVDAPESDFKRYGRGETNFDRIRQQAAELGQVTPEQAVEIGHQAKDFTLKLLGSAPFEIFTKWDSPFHDDRFHAFILVRENGQPRLLYQLLIERGLARIKTKPAPLPDGTPVAAGLDRLRKSQAEAKRRRLGVWAL